MENGFKKDRLRWGKCVIKGPDSKKRHGWELFVNDTSFGKDEIKERLRATYERVTAPPISFHWKNSAWKQWARKKPKKLKSYEEKYEEKEKNELEELF